MSFLNKFKYHYHLKHIDALFGEENYEEIFEYLTKIKKDEKSFYEISLKYISNSINNFNKDVSDKKIVWLNSFLNEDADYLKLFLNYLTDNSKNLKQDINTYQFEINQVVQREEIINFNTLVNQSYFFQWMILNKSNIKFKFLQNDIPFFSSENNYNFTKQSLSQSYILILNNPYQVYTKIKNSSNQDQEVARNLFLNLDQKAKDEDHSKAKFIFPNKGWHVHTESWADPNVISSLRGKIISKKEICNNTFETLSDIVLHLIQSGIDMNLNYDLIEDFIKRNPIADEKDDINISNKEKKFLSSYVDATLDLYDI